MRGEPGEGGASARLPAYGRSAVLEEIDRTLEQAQAAGGPALLLFGPGGIGKTVALRHAQERAHGRGFRVIEGRALPDDLPAPFSLVRDLIRSASEAERRLPSADGSGPIVPPLALTEATPPSPTPAVSPAGDPGSALAELDRLLAPLGRTAVEGLGAIRDRLYVRLTEYFLELAKTRPLLLAVDDLHFADPSSLLFLLRLAPELTGRRVAVVATVGEGTEVPPRSRELIDRMARTPPFRSVTLRPLTVAEVGELVTAMLGGAAPSPEDVRRWHAQTDGNPLFVEQVVRSSTGSSPPAAVAATAGGVAGVLLRRAEGLSAADRRVLTYAAVLGREFDFPRLAGVIGGEEERVTESIDRLVREGLLREKGGEVYEFVSEAVRAGIYAELTETRRRILHRKVGGALETQGGASDSELARQFYLGRDDAKAIDYNLRAAERATRVFAFDSAVAYVSRALEALRRSRPGDRRTEVRILIEEGRLLDEAGDLRRAQEALEEAVALARAEPSPGLELGRALLGLAANRSERTDYSGAVELAQEAVPLVEAAHAQRDLFAAHRVLGTAFWRLGDVPAAERHQRAALAIAEKDGTPLEHGHALVDVANLLHPSGGDQRELALDLYQRAADLFATGDDLNARARVLMNRGVLEHSIGRREEAVRDLERALEAAEQSRSPIWIGYCLINLAQWQAEDGRAAEARETVDRAAHAVEPSGDRLALQQIAMIRGQVAEAEGDFETAEARFREALATARELHLVAETAEMLFRLAHLSERRSNRPEARRRLAEAKAAGLLEHRPDLAPQVQALEAALSAG